MVRTASAAATLLFAAGLGGAALAQEPQALPSPILAVKSETPSAAPAPTAPALSQAMQAQALADAPPPPPPPAAPVAAPSVAVAAEAIAPAAKAPLKIAFAAPPAAAELVKATAPVQVAVAPAPPPLAAPALVKVAVEPAPVAPPAAPPLAPQRAATPSAKALVAHRITDAAGAFDAWTEKAGRIDGKFSNAAGVSAALVDTSAYQAQQLEEGAIAFGALVALQDPVFVQSAHELASLGGDHDAAAALLLREPAQVMTLPGADAAAAFTAHSIASRAQAVITAGKSVRQAAYSMQSDPWAKTAVSTPEKRLAEAKTRSSTAIALDGPASELLMKRLVELRTSRQSTAAQAGAPTPLVTRSLALAALIVLGEADEAHAAALTPFLSENKSTDCLKMAKLNFFQCLSVAGPHYEDAFCVGQHGLGDAGQCIAAATGVAAPVAAAPVLLAVAAPAPSAGVSVPIALLAEGGPERSAAFAPRQPSPEPQAAPPASPPLMLAQAAAPRADDQPAWAREPAPPQPRAYAQAQDDDASPQAAPRVDRSMAYRWNRQARATDYAAPSYAPQSYDPRQGYGQYGQYAQPDPRQPQANGYDARDGDDDAEPVDPRTLAPQRGYWGYR